MSHTEMKEKDSANGQKGVPTILAAGIIVVAFIISLVLGGVFTGQSSDVDAHGGRAHIEALQISFQNPSIFLPGCESLLGDKAYADRDELTVIADFYLVNEESFDQTVFIQLKVRGESVATGGYVAPAETAVPREIRAENVNCTVVQQEVEVVLEPAGV